MGRSARSALDEVRLQYGGGTIELRKSRNFIGLRSDGMFAGAIDPVLAGSGAWRLEPQFGSFELIQFLRPSEATDALLDAMRSEPGVALGTHAYHIPGSDLPIVPTGSIYLELHEDTAKGVVNRLLQQHQLCLIGGRAANKLIVRTTRASANPVKVAAALQRSKAVAVAEPDFATAVQRSTIAVPTDPLLAQQWHLRNMGTFQGSNVGMKTGADARVIDGWLRAGTLGDPSVIIAMIDDGFDIAHPDLAGPGKIRSPWNFADGNADPRPTYRVGYPVSVSGIWIGDWHGTACAGLAVGRAEGAGIVGAAPGASLMPLKMPAALTDAAVVAMFDYCSQKGASVVSCSWEPPPGNMPLSHLKSDALRECATQGRGGLGCVIVFAAGNYGRNINDAAGGYVNGFAAHPNVIAVSASTSRDENASYSNYGNEISVCAPGGAAGGAGIVTADVTGTFSSGGQTVSAGSTPDSFNSAFYGTSAAAPVVAGICALLLSVRPALTAAQVKATLQRTARKIGPASAYGANGHSQRFGFGCVSADTAIAEVLAT